MIPVPARSAPRGKLQHRFQGPSRPPAARKLHLPGQAAGFLTQAHRGRVGQVRSTNLEDAIPFLGLVRQHRLEPGQGRQQLLLDRLGRRHVNRRGEHVVGRLSHVHVVIGVDRLFFVEAVAFGQFDGTIADDLVRIHVRRGSGPGLVHADRELVVVLSFRHFAGRGHDGLGDFGLQEPQIAIDLSGGGS